MHKVRTINAFKNGLALGSVAEGAENEQRWSVESTEISVARESERTSGLAGSLLPNSPRGTTAEVRPTTIFTSSCGAKSMPLHTSQSRSIAGILQSNQAPGPKPMQNAVSTAIPAPDFVPHGTSVCVW